MGTSEGQTRTTLELRAFIDAFPAIAWSALPDGSLDFVNQRFRDYTGLSSDRLYGAEWKAAVHRDDVPKIETWWQNISQSQGPGTTEKRLRRFDGEYRWFQIAAAPVHDEQAGLVRWCGINTDIHELKCSEQKLREQEADLRTITDAIRQAVVVLAPDGTALYANRVALEITGLTTSEVNGSSFLTRVFHPDDVDRIRAERQERLLLGTPFELEMRALLKSGEYHWYLNQYNPLKDAGGRIIRWYVTGTDIDGQKRAEQELKRSEQFLAEGQRLSRTGSFSWRVSTDEITWSEQLYRIFEFDDRLPVTLERIGSRVYPDDLPLLQDMIERSRHAASDFEYQHRLLMPDQSVKHIHLFAHATRDMDGRLEYVGAAQDVTDLHTITDAIANPIVVLTPDGTTLYANRVALDQSGLTPSEAESEGFFPRACHPDDIDGVRDERSVGLQQGIPFELEMRLLKNGEYRWQLIQYNPLKEESGQIIRWYATATDIDDQKRTEERLRNENVVLREEIDRSSMFEEIVGSSKPMRQVLTQVEKVAPSDSTVLILGETGTGKELIARALHKRSTRATRAFIRVNCAAIPQSLIASELFGHEKGAFTGALQRRLGRFEAANGGTIFLDEIGELPMETQIALLRVLQEREFERVGSNHPISVDVRVIAATNRDLQAAVAAGTFRQDLFYRLNVFPIVVPPLRERAEDVPLLVEYFVGRYANAAGRKMRHIGKDTLEALRAYQWPGNIRELQNVVERAVILSEDDTFVVDERWLKRESTHSPHSDETLSVLMTDRELETIEAALAESHGRIAGPAGAAAKLGIPRQTLESKIRRLGIDKYKHKQASL